ncbi:MAG: hypothetical protein QOC99_503 [Acidobacteriota bacterium]|jgi:uncharacterized protein (DUF488 family)|nr:hypothetical protein [Acidobacteriota bacterium]MDT7777991.1 hypothetical protein [Acidobacteriota bacterium]
MPFAPVTIYTIGHGRHAWAEFLALLRQYEVEIVCDVRSAARSRWPQFNGQVLAGNLKESGVGYEWLPECGGKVVAPLAELNRGLERILELAADARIALMCSESQPLTAHKQPRANCHRVGLLSPPLSARGARLIHILPNGDALEIDEASLPSIW